MLKINFYPESDKPKFIRAAKEYQEIWEREGQNIVQKIEKLSGLLFTTTVINAVTFEGISFSEPMRLRSSYTNLFKKCVLAHELIHRLMIDNNFWFENRSTFEEDVHKVLDLIYYDLLVELWGENVAEEAKETEISYGNPVYRNAWDWALSFSKEERGIKFKEMVKTYKKKV